MLHNVTLAISQFKERAWSGKQNILKRIFSDPGCFVVASKVFNCLQQSTSALGHWCEQMSHKFLRDSIRCTWFLQFTKLICKF